MSRLTLAKRAGEEDALSAFGLLNTTKSPPATWTHGRSAKNVTIPSMRELKLRG